LGRFFRPGATACPFLPARCIRGRVVGRDLPWISWLLVTARYPLSGPYPVTLVRVGRRRQRLGLPYRLCAAIDGLRRPLSVTGNMQYLGIEAESVDSSLGETLRAWIPSGFRTASGARDGQAGLAGCPFTPSPTRRHYSGLGRSGACDLLLSAMMCWTGPSGFALPAGVIFRPSDHLGPTLMLPAGVTGFGASSGRGLSFRLIKAGKMNPRQAGPWLRSSVIFDFCHRFANYTLGIGAVS
jgi:hypothetical protein